MKNIENSVSLMEETQETCDWCDGQGHIYFFEIKELIKFLREKGVYEYKEAIVYARDCKKYNNIECPQCGGKGYEIKWR